MVYSHTSKCDDPSRASSPLTFLKFFFSGRLFKSNRFSSAAVTHGGLPTINNGPLVVQFATLGNASLKAFAVSIFPHCAAFAEYPG